MVLLCLQKKLDRIRYPLSLHCPVSFSLLTIILLQWPHVLSYLLINTYIVSPIHKAFTFHRKNLYFCLYTFSSSRSPQRYKYHGVEYLSYHVSYRSIISVSFSLYRNIDINSINVLMRFFGRDRDPIATTATAAVLFILFKRWIGMEWSETELET